MFRNLAELIDHRIGYVYSESLCRFPKNLRVIIKQIIMLFLMITLILWSSSQTRQPPLNWIVSDHKTWNKQSPVWEAELFTLRSKFNSFSCSQLCNYLRVISFHLAITGTLHANSSNHLPMVHKLSEPSSHNDRFYIISIIQKDIFLNATWPTRSF